MSNRYQIDQRAALFGARGPRPRPAPDADRSSTSCALEQQNDEQLDDLESRIHTLRQISEDINSEVSDSNKLLGGMDSQFDKARGMLKGTMGRLNVMVQQGGPKRLCHLVAVVVVVFLLMWLLSRQLHPVDMTLSDATTEPSSDT
eukprot:CAMPEP_0204274066 /NCGR_PEP_ID=MMETSP0468-20130131/24973_1 /ASSEMBLY_ACC=CAM_ASM_000383 /TAXON_ID=2969 /ORGANISM="Oxyrrhis marina" /LENGTH=144 /DNA_ID=CAMNT_0051250217 /DNA_START=45 /DNA_END=479 /DNA_ORIENTATION=-